MSNPFSESRRKSEINAAALATKTKTVTTILNEDVLWSTIFPRMKSWIASKQGCESVVQSINTHELNLSELVKAVNTHSLNFNSQSESVEKLNVLIAEYEKTMKSMSARIKTLERQLAQQKSTEELEARILESLETRLVEKFENTLREKLSISIPTITYPQTVEIVNDDQDQSSINVSRVTVVEDEDEIETVNDDTTNRKRPLSEPVEKKNYKKLKKSANYDVIKSKLIKIVSTICEDYQTTKNTITFNFGNLIRDLRDKLWLESNLSIKRPELEQTIKLLFENCDLTMIRNKKREVVFPPTVLNNL